MRGGWRFRWVNTSGTPSPALAIGSGIRLEASHMQAALQPLNMGNAVNTASTTGEQRHQRDDGGGGACWRCCPAGPRNHSAACDRWHARERSSRVHRKASTSWPLSCQPNVLHPAPLTNPMLFSTRRLAAWPARPRLIDSGLLWSLWLASECLARSRCWPSRVAARIPLAGVAEEPHMHATAKPCWSG